MLCVRTPIVSDNKQPPLDKAILIVKRLDYKSVCGSGQCTHWLPRLYAGHSPTHKDVSRVPTHGGVLLLFETRYLVIFPVRLNHSHARNDVGHLEKTHTEKDYLVVYLPRVDHQLHFFVCVRWKTENEL